MSAVALPSQDQLYSLFAQLNGRMGIRKPNKLLIEFLLPTSSSQTTSAVYRTNVAAAAAGTEGEEEACLSNDVPARPKEKEAASSANNQSENIRPTAAVNSGEDTEDLGEEETLPPRTCEVPLAQRTELCIDDSVHHLGNRNVGILLELIAECPLLQKIDLSKCQCLFVVDSLKLCPTGNDLLKRLGEIGTTHPSIREIVLTGHPVGTLAVQSYLIPLAAVNPNITQIAVDEENIDEFVYQKLQRVLQKNRAYQKPKEEKTKVELKDARTVPPMPETVSSRLANVPYADRKTAAQRQKLQFLLQDHSRTFGALAEDERDAVILNAEAVPLNRAVQMSIGLRGDGEHLIIVDSGELQGTAGLQDFTLERGDFFGENIEGVMFSAGQISVRTRGEAFLVPLRLCKSLVSFWEKQIETFMPYLRLCPYFQCLPVWVLLRLCQDAKMAAFEPGDVAVPRHSPFAGLFLVIEGKFVVYQDKRKPSRFIFTTGDLFGEETVAIRRLTQSTVDILAADGSASRCVLLSRETCLRHVVPHLRTPLQLQAKGYTLYLKD